ncbi:GFA family protein [Pararhodobacter sp. CCB-MM2]|uniref:GFA family protein n=1 Tax=Pararhodobacter sp. CCB-MM2 TaxID=1786003 RepID=UPI000833F26E|nr:GFA family protein [Pararhodobacter sp. CCB-MM2]
MSDGWTDHPGFSGGCQCGAVRYRVASGPTKAVICHCRMCQRATGNAFAPLLQVKPEAVTWTGTPSEWASSSVAWRGFCRTCGTPLYFRTEDGIELMAGTMAPGTPFEAQYNASVESRVGWLGALHDAPSRTTDPAILAEVESYQSPEE